MRVGHSITALIVPGPCHERAVQEWDVVPVALDSRLFLIHLSHFYTAYWQARRGETAQLDVPAEFPAIFPREGVVISLVSQLTGARRCPPTFALVMTDYFGGIGGQWACAFLRGQRLPEVGRINNALRTLGVQAFDGVDEFDVVGLGEHRSTPEYLDRYVQLCEDLGV